MALFTTLGMQKDHNIVFVCGCFNKVICKKVVFKGHGADLFTPTFFRIFSTLLGSKIRTTNHYNKTTHMRNSGFFNKFSSILTFSLFNNP